MVYSWRNTVLPIAAIFSFRMLGLFMLIPVFSLMALQLEYATPTLIGFALGGYGLSQGFLQIPFGILSDRWGRKPLITIGLVLFALGSLLGAMTHSIYGMIAARFLQGMGAIGSVLIALLADLTPEKVRTKAMAVIGATIGTSFSLAMVLSPYLTKHYGLAGIFYFTFILALIGLALLLLYIPTPKQEHFHPESEANPKLLRTVLLDTQLQRLNFGIFCQHFILTATFYALPLLLQAQTQQQHLNQQWHFYLPVIVLSFLFMVPFLIVAERKKVMRLVFLGAVVTTAFSQIGLVLQATNLVMLYAIMILYFIGFNFLEASLPSLISKQTSVSSKGTAMGVYSTFQFLGIFIGGASAGLLYQHGGLNAIFIFNFFLTLLWLLCAWKMPTTGIKK